MILNVHGSSSLFGCKHEKGGSHGIHLHNKLFVTIHIELLPHAVFPKEILILPVILYYIILYCLILVGLNMIIYYWSFEFTTKDLW